MPTVQNSIPLSEEANNMQREYVAQVRRLRGYVDKGYACPPASENVDLETQDVTEGGQIQIKGAFASPPIAAYLDGKFPLSIHATANSDKNGHSLGNYRISIGVPSGTTKQSGLVTLIWPSKQVLSNQPIRIVRPPIIQRLQLPKEDVGQDDYLEINKLKGEPVEVHVGGRVVQDWEWDGNRLFVKIPPDLPTGSVLVGTADNKIYETTPFNRGYQK